MKRTLYSRLQDWKKSDDRMPLLLMGARQTGKSWILRNFGENEFDFCVIVDFEQETETTHEIATVIKKHGLNAKKILAAAGIDGTSRRLDNTLIVFDEIQRNPRMFTALKYICQDCPEAHVVASGSLMGLALKSGTRAPVGYVDVERMLPMTFYEFLEAANEKDALNIISQQKWNDYSKYASVFEKRLNQYLIVGGMPKAVSAFLKNENFEDARRIHKQILLIYEQDFNIHSDTAEFTEKIRYAWEIACHLSGERNEERIFYQKMPGKRAADYYAAVRWLSDCGLIHICYRCSEAQGILGMNIDYKNSNKIKIFLLDIGLRLTACNISTQMLSDDNVHQKKGEIVEQFIFQQLLSETILKGIANPAYYSWQHHGKMYEIDFMIPDECITVPIEVKSGNTKHDISMKKFQEQFSPKKVVRLTTKNPGCQPPVWSLPLGMCQSIFKFIDKEWNLQ